MATPLYKAEDALFYEVKGAVEALLAKFVGDVKFEAEGCRVGLRRGVGRGCCWSGEEVGVFGELSAAEMQARKLRQPCVIASIDGQRLFESGVAAAGGAGVVAVPGSGERFFVCVSGCGDVGCD